MRNHRRREAGFTLMELMVVIVIVAILAAVAVPLYINYVRDAQRTEAKGAIGAIVTAEQVHFQRTGSYINYTDADFATPPAPPNPVLSCDVTEAQRTWTFNVTGASASGFTVRAVGDGASNDGLEVQLVYSRTADPVWTEK